MTKTPSIRVCLVEDDARLRGLMARWLGQEAGLVVVSQYPNAETALAGLPQDRPDVVLVDINLPGQSGIECVRQMKPRLPKAGKLTAAHASWPRCAPGAGGMAAAALRDL